MTPTIEAVLSVAGANAIGLLLLIGWTCIAERWCDKHKGS